LKAAKRIENLKELKQTKLQKRRFRFFMVELASLSVAPPLRPSHGGEFCNKVTLRPPTEGNCGIRTSYIFHREEYSETVGENIENGRHIFFTEGSLKNPKLAKKNLLNN
jgi:hypothetical protein